MNARIKNVLSIVFLLAGVLVLAYMIRYIVVTEPRDAAQERCNTQTLEVLADWVQNRHDRDNSIDARDDAAIAVLDKLIVGQQPTPEELLHWRDTVTNAAHVRDTAGVLPLPVC